MPEVATDPTAASEEERRDSRMILESAPGMISFASLFLLSIPSFVNMFAFISADPPQDSDDFEPSMQLLMMLRRRAWRQKVFRLSPNKVFCSNGLFFLEIILILFFLPLAGCEATRETILPSSEPEQVGPKVGREVRTSSTNLGMIKGAPCAKIPSSESLEGNS